MIKYAKVLALVGFVAAACGGASSFGSNSETHFLGYCEDDECGDGLSCVCGVCTVTCDPAASCSELHAGAVCRGVSGADAMSCGEQSQPSVCDVRCETNADCKSVSNAHECTAGFCRLPGCVYQGRVYERGETFPAPGAENCNTCTCGSDGQVLCTRLACLPDSCEYAGGTYDIGETFPAGDGCNTCSCMSDGTVGCTMVACAGTCEYNGVSYPDGASFPAGDGCNTCSCEAGAVLCSEIGCDICQLPFDGGPCNAAFPVYWHDPETGTCQQRTYGGCQGNDNRFETLEACEAACGG